MVIQINFQQNIIKKMGINQSKNAKLLRFDKEQWRFQSQVNQVKMYVNIYDGREAELHEVMVNSSVNLDEQYQIYNYRRVQESALVTVYAVDHQYQDSAVCGYQGKLLVLIQRIPFRLRDLPPLKQNQIYYILCEAIRGFATCFRNVGLFRITNKMIGIDRKGHSKIWLHNNFALNLPQDQKLTLQTTSTINLKINTHRHQLDMLHTLLKIVQDKCQNGKYTSNFHRVIYQASSFEQAYQQIQNYCRQKNINVPDRIMCQKYPHLIQYRHQNDSNSQFRIVQTNSNHDLIVQNQLNNNYNQHNHKDSSSYQTNLHQGHQNNQYIPYQYDIKPIGSYGKQSITQPYMNHENNKSQYQYKSIRLVNQPSYQAFDNRFTTYTHQPLTQAQNQIYNTNYGQYAPSSYNHNVSSFNQNNDIKYVDIKMNNQPLPSFQQFSSYRPKQSQHETIIDKMQNQPIKTNSYLNFQNSSRFNNNADLKTTFDQPYVHASKTNYQFPSSKIQTNHLNYIQSPVKVDYSNYQNSDNNHITTINNYSYDNKPYYMPQLTKPLENYSQNSYQTTSYLPANHQVKYQSSTPNYSLFNVNQSYA